MRDGGATTLDKSFAPELYLWFGGFVLLALLSLVLVHGQFHLLAALMIGTALFAVSRSDPATAILLTFAYLFLMGDVRRILAIAAPQPAFDPLLLIGPGMAVSLALPRFYGLKLKDNLSKAMLALLVIMTLEIFNPSQGSLAVGLSGAFFYIIPVLWFWVGRSLASPALVERILYQVLLPLSVLAALLGLYQTFFGFLPYQQAWVNSATRILTSLYVGSSIRPFGFSISPAEYATLLEFGILISVSAFFAGRRAWILFFPLLVTGLILESSRGFVVGATFALSVVWVMRRGQRLRPGTILLMVLFGGLSLVGLSTIAAHFAPPDTGPSKHTTAAQNEISHQLGGLAHPLDPKYSTAGTHAAMVTTALGHAMTHPLGSGLGFTTFAAEKINGSSTTQGSSEVDLSDMFVALGVAGGLIYLTAAIMILRRVLRQVRTVPLHISLCVLALIIATFSHWLVGGQYSTSSLLFFLFGSLVYQPTRSNDGLRQANASS